MHASGQPVNTQGIPAEIVDLCRILKDQIINQCSCLPEVTTDFAGMPRPSGGGCDCGALECDSGSTDPPGHGLVSLRLEVTPPAPQSCQTVRWSIQGQADQVVSVRLYLRTPDGRYTLGQPVLERASQDASVACAALPRPPSGIWWAMVRAIGVHGEDLGSSNEVELLFDPLVVIQPPSPAPPRDVELPPPLVRLPPRADLTLPPVPGGPGRLTETDIWMGRGALPRPPANPSSGRLTKTCVWLGRPCPP